MKQQEKHFPPRRSWDAARYRPLMPHERESAERECAKLGLDPNEGERFDRATGEWRPL